ncbi:hypothetical protein PVAG01_11109 [Phlyctema vagabunda]|uniref:Ribosome assembly protein 3 n=1 Tax=Phlyctema vagabunda TaxID=108571 RepID=A0ABR4P1C6_9HELO
MAPPANTTAASKPRRHKKRKSRTQVSDDSSSSSSSSDSDSSHSAAAAKPSKKAKTSKTSLPQARAQEQQQQLLPQPQPKADPTTTAFTSFMLQTSTLEFADDLDLVRAADDFKGGESIEMLVCALKQGTGCFSADEMRRVVGSGVEK